MPTQPYSAPKCWPSAFCPASGFHLPYHFRSLNREVWQRSLFCSPVGTDVRQPSWHQPYRSADLCSVSSVCVSDSQWVWNLVEHTIPATVPYQGWEPGVDGGEHCGYEGLYTPASQTSRWTCLSCCQKGHFIWGINSEVKGTTWKFRRMPNPACLSLLPETSNSAKLLKRKIVFNQLNYWRPSSRFAWHRNMQTKNN